MKVAILSIAFLIAAAVAAETPEASVECKVNGSLLPNPEDCSSFFSCDNGVARLTYCPPGLHFNPEVLVCDRPENVNCEGSTAQPTTAEPTTPTVKPTTAEPTTTTVKPTTAEPTTTTVKPTTAEPTTTSQPNVTSTTTSAPNVTSTSEPLTTTSLAPNVTSTSSPLTTTSLSPNVTSTPKPTTLPPALAGCPANGSAIIANPTNCSSFLVCINGANTTVNCPPDMLFNPEVNECDLAENVDCQVGEPTTTETPTTTTEQPTEASTDGTVTPTTGIPGNETTTGSPGNGTTTEEPGYTPDCLEEGYLILENPESCSSFYVCVNGVSGLIECPVGNDFNPGTNHCDLPANPNCRNPTEPPTTPDTYVPPCPANGTVQLPNPADCSSFYICINSNYAKLSCPENHSFNETLQKCTPGSCNANLTRSFYFECEEDGYFPNPEDCSSYYVCAGNQVFLQNCPDGLHFDVSLGTCNTPEAANCQLDSTTGEPITTDGTTVTSSPTTTSGTPSETTTEEPTTTTSPTAAPSTSTASPGNPGCPDDGVAILPDPDDCTQFIVCIDGDYDVVECPDGYGFNEELGTCDLAENVGCGTSPSEPDCPSSGTATLPNPQDCESYYICINGNAALIKCPAGFNFDKETGSCSADAECPLSTTSSPTDTPTADTTSSSAPTTVSDSTPSDGTTPTEGPTDSPTTSGPVSCDGVEDGGLLPNPDSCTSFFQCANGIPLPIDCPLGLEFNAEAQVCDNPETSGCSSKSRRLLNKILGFFKA